MNREVIHLERATKQEVRAARRAHPAAVIEVTGRRTRPKKQPRQPVEAPQMVARESRYGECNRCGSQRQRSGLVVDETKREGAFVSVTYRCEDAEFCAEVAERKNATAHAKETPTEAGSRGGYAAAANWRQRQGSVISGEPEGT